MRQVGRQREKNRRFPIGWEQAKNGTIYFRPTNAADKAIVLAITQGPLSLRLGKTYDEAHTAFSELIVKARKKREQQQLDFVPGTVSELVFKAHETTPEKTGFLESIQNSETRKWRERHLDELRREFGNRRYAYSELDIAKAPRNTYLQEHDINMYLARNKLKRPVAANRAVQTWSLLFRAAKKMWNLTRINPCADAQFNPEEARTVLPEDEEFFQVLRHLDPPMRGLLALSRYYGRRPGEGRKVDLPKDGDKGLSTVRGKRPRQLILEWDDVMVKQQDGSYLARLGRLRKLVARQLRWREKVLHPNKVWKNGKRPKAPERLDDALFINRDGKRITKSGFYTAFRRAMERAGLTTFTGIEVMLDGKERRRTKRSFNPNDARAKRASTLPRGVATEVLAHDEERTTNSVYRRGPQYIRVPDHGNSRKRSENSGNPTGDPEVGT